MLDKKKAAYWMFVVLTAIAIITFVLGLSSFAHGSITGVKKNSLGVIPYQDNPFVYIAGTLAQGEDAVANVQGNLNLRINPLGTYLMYDESILFCGFPVDKFDGIGNVFLLTYERIAHRAVEGVGCHNLVRVDNLVLKGMELR